MRCSFFCPTDAIGIGYINSWRVNGVYRFAAIEKNESLELPYITKTQKVFTAVSYAILPRSIKLIRII
jgi:hypothetical protein